MAPIATAMFKMYAPTLIASRGSDGAMRVEGIASSTVRDHHGDVITEKALRKMAKSALGMTIFMDHKYDLDDIFGKVEKAKVVKTADIDERTGSPIYDMRLGVRVAKKNDRAVKAFELMSDPDPEERIKLGMSIGAMVPEGGATFDKSQGGRYIVDDLDIVETSIVSMPANPRSWVDYAVKSLKQVTSPDLLKDGLKVDDDGVIDVADVAETTGAAEMNGEPQEPQVGEADPDGEERVGIEAPADGTEVELVAEGDGEPAEPLEAQTVGEADEATTEETPDDPDAMPVEKTKVSVWDGDKVIEVDTGRSRAKSETEDQSAQAEPETAGGSTGTKSLDLDHPLVKSLTGQLAALKAQVEADTEAHQAEIDAITAQRDAAIGMASSTIDQSQAILKALEEKPIGRKTAGRFDDPDVEKARVDLDSLKAIYGEDLLAFMKKGN